MTELVFRTDGVGNFCGFKARGHSGYASAGEDMVCAAVSACVTLVECALNDVRRAEAAVSVSEEEIDVALPEDCAEKEFGDSLLRAFYQTFREYEKEYGKYLRVSIARK